MGNSNYYYHHMVALVVFEYCAPCILQCLHSPSDPKEGALMTQMDSEWFGN